MPGKDDAVRRRVEAVSWYHEFDFGDGLVTKSIAPFKELWTMTERFLDKVDFRGKRVLDIGCWDGYWSFYAERRGAAEVLATDMNSQRWADWSPTAVRRADVSDNEGFRIAHEIYHSKVQYRGDVSVYDIGALGRRFDIILFLGVYYHLTHPMYAITQVRHCLAPSGEMIIEGGAIDDTVNSYMEFYYGGQGPEPYRVMDASNWSMPTRRCLRDMVSSTYFNVIDEDFLPHPQLECGWHSVQPGLLGYIKRRICGDGAKKEAIPQKRLGRVMLRAQAVEREDTNHFYPPLFNLHLYDPRFRKGGVSEAK